MSDKLGGKSESETISGESEWGWTHEQTGHWPSQEGCLHRTSSWLLQRYRQNSGQPDDNIESLDEEGAV